MRSRLVTAWSMLPRLALKETCVPSGRASSRMSSDPCVWIVGPALARAVAEAPARAGGLMPMAIPSSARPGRSRFACPGAGALDSGARLG